MIINIIVINDIISIVNIICWLISDKTSNNCVSLKKKNILNALIRFSGHI